MRRSVALRVAATGWSTTFQDLGRRDAERLGVPAGGAADQHSAAVANILVGNPRDATLVESTGGRVAIVPESDVLVAVTGTPAEVTVGGAPVEQWAPIVVPAGHELSVSAARLGARSYLALHGDLLAPRFLGSTAPDARMGFPQTIAAGQRLQLETPFHGFTRSASDRPLFRLPVPIPSFSSPVWTVDLVAAPLTDGIPGLRELMARSRYTVTPRSNHVGLRLDGPVLHPRDASEIVSHGVPVGAVEIPHGDELIVLGRYRTLTAGYPVVGFATRGAQSLLGQAAPGRVLAFAWVEHAEARRRVLEAEGRLVALQAAVDRAFGAAGFAPGRGASSDDDAAWPDTPTDHAPNATVF